MVTVTFVVALLFANAAQTASQEPTLLDLARQHGGVVVWSHADGFSDGPPSAAKLLQQADVIVHGTVVEAEGRLSQDQRRVLTDYRVQPLRVLRDRQKVVLDSSHPVLFTAFGGTVIVEGLKITYSVEHDTASIQFDVGDEVIFFGKERATGLMIYPFDVFRVRDGVVVPNGRLADVASSGVPLSEFLARVSPQP
jgi:hypothetical protein